MNIEALKWNEGNMLSSEPSRGVEAESAFSLLPTLSLHSINNSEEYCSVGSFIKDRRPVKYACICTWFELLQSANKY